MVNDKNRLYTREDATKDAKHTNKVRTQQQFSRFSVTEPNAINVASSTQPPPALQIQTKPNIGSPYNDTYGTIGSITQIIFLDVFGSNYNIMKINGDVTFAFDKIPQGRHIEFTLDFVIDTVTPPTVTLDPGVINAPTLPTLTNGLRVVLNFIGVVDDVDTRFIYIGGTIDTGGGGVSFPIIPPVDVRGNVSTTQNIDLSATTAHSTTMTLTSDIAITFSSFPATANQIEWEIEIKQDGTGGWDVTSWPAGVISIPTIDKTAGNTTLIVLRTNDNGTTINTLFSSLGSVSVVSDWATFTAVTNINAGNFDILAIKNMDFDNATSKITGLKTLEFFDDAPNKTITTSVNAFEFRTVALDQFDFFIDNIIKFRIEQAGAAQPALVQFFGGSIEDVGEIIFDLATDAIIISSEAGIGFDNTATEMIFNVPTANNFVWTIAGVNAMLLSNTSLTFPNETQIICAPSTNLAGLNVGAIADTSLTVPSNGDIHYDTLTNKFRFRENGAYVELGGGAFPVTDAVFQVVDDIDATKTWQVSLAGVSTADQMLFNFSATASRTYTFGDGGGSVVLSPMFENLDANGFVLDNVSRINQVGAVPTSGFINMANSQQLSWEASPAGADGTLSFTSSEFFTFGGSSAYSVVHTNGASLGTSGIRWGTLWAVAVDITGTLQVDGTMILGDTSGDQMTVNASSIFNANVDLSDNEINDVSRIDITTPAGAAVASIIGFDAATDLLQIDLGASVDFLITDNGTTRLEFNNTLLKWQFGGSSVVALPQETQISDRASAPSTPPAGFMNMYVINVAGVQTFRVKFDNGTEKTIATDV